MLKQFGVVLVVSSLAVALVGCPSQSTDSSTTPARPGATAAGSERSDKVAEATANIKEGAKQMSEGAKQLGSEAGQKAEDATEKAKAGLSNAAEQVKQGANDATEKAKEGLANFSADVKAKYPKLAESMQSHLDAMNKWAVETYRDTFSADAPERDSLVAAFKDEAVYKPKYSIDSFVVDSQTDTVAVATVAITYTGTDVAKPQATQHKKYKYTFHKAAADKDWKVYKIEPLA